MGRGELGECKEWTGAKAHNGYGLVKRKGITWRVHRLEWIMNKGPIPDGLLVLHKCDNPACYNLDHLYLGTQSDNMKDCVVKGRHANNCKVGEEHPRAKLTKEKAEQIRADSRSHRVLASLYGVSATAVANIKANRSWK